MLADGVFVANHRKAPANFTRKRDLPFPRLCVLLMNFLRSSIQTEMEAFFAELAKNGEPVSAPTASAFCSARKKLRHTAFVEMNKVSVEMFYREGNPVRWRTWRILGVDGSTLQLPESPSVREEFPTKKSAANFPLARVSFCFDPLNGLFVDAVMGRFAIAEKDMAMAHLHVFGPGDLILGDRGYGAHWYMRAVLNTGGDFLIRLATKVWSVQVKGFLDSGAKEQVVALSPSQEAVRKCRQLGLATDPLQVRLIRVDLPEGVEVLATSVLAPERLSVLDAADLYAIRWGGEGQIRWAKLPAEMENFTGKSAENVRQDFHARILMLNMASFLVRSVDHNVQSQTADRKHTYRVNFTHALSCMRSVGPKLLLLAGELGAVIQSLRDMVVRALLPLRPGRAKPRVIKCPRRRFHMCYKPIL